MSCIPPYSQTGADAKIRLLYPSLIKDYIVLESTESPETSRLPENLPVFRIEPPKGFFSLGLRELWTYRELFFFLVWRDVKVRYKQTVLGASWAILQPLLTMIVFSLFFGRLAKIPSDGVPYPIFSFTALVPWQFFAAGMAMAANSLVADSNLLKKVYFPRLIIPASNVLTNGVDFLLAFLVLIVLIGGFRLTEPTPLYAYFLQPFPWDGINLTPGMQISYQVIFLPLFVLLALVTALGVSFWLSAMNVQFRDVRYTIPFIVQSWMFITPIAYPSSLITNPTLRAVYGLNPMAGVVEGFRWALLGTSAAPGPVVLASALVAVVVFVTGLMYFQRMENTFADVV